MTRLNRPLTQSELKVLKFLADKYELGEKDFFKVSEIYKGINREVAQVTLYLVLGILADYEYIESMKFGKFNNYYRGFRIKLVPDWERFKSVTRANTRVHETESGSMDNK